MPPRTRRGAPRTVSPGLEPLEERLLLTYTLAFRGAYLPVEFTPNVADFNGDGWNDILGAQNNQAGQLVFQDPNRIGLGEIFGNRLFRDQVVADFNGDGIPDVVCNTYASANDPNSTALLFLGDGDGTYREDPAFAALNLRGRGETIVVADFANNG